MAFTIEDMFLGEEHMPYKDIPKRSRNWRSYFYPLIAMLTGKEDVHLVHVCKETKHLPYLVELFPNIKIDAYFAVKEIASPQITYYKKFDDKVASTYSRDVFLFLHDYAPRVGRHETIYTYFKEMSEKFLRWYKIINPYSSLIKFFLPYPGVSSMARFLDGTLLNVPYTSMVYCYIIPNGLEKTWDLKEYDERMAYFSQVTKNKLYINEGQVINYEVAYSLYVFTELSKSLK